MRQYRDMAEDMFAVWPSPGNADVNLWRQGSPGNAGGLVTLRKYCTRGCTGVLGIEKTRLFPARIRGGPKGQLVLELELKAGLDLSLCRWSQGGSHGKNPGRSSEEGPVQRPLSGSRLQR